MPALRSAAISHANYDPAETRLYLTFRNGGTYAYEAVPPRIYMGLLRASSAGRFFHNHIQDRYSHCQVAKAGFAEYDAA